MREHPLTGVLFPVCDGKRHGYGLRVFSTGVQYEGQWELDQMQVPARRVVSCRVVSCRIVATLHHCSRAPDPCPLDVPSRPVTQVRVTRGLAQPPPPAQRSTASA